MKSYSPQNDLCKSCAIIKKSFFSSHKKNLLKLCRPSRQKISVIKFHTRNALITVKCSRLQLVYHYRGNISDSFESWYPSSIIAHPFEAPKLTALHFFNLLWKNVLKCEHFMTSKLFLVLRAQDVFFSLIVSLSKATWFKKKVLRLISNFLQVPWSK